MYEIELAAKIATKRDDKRTFKIGAVAIRKDGAIVGARNEWVNIPAPSGHAEARLMRKAGYGSIVYVARVMANGTFGMAKPCDRCMAILMCRGVKCVYYTTYDGIEKLMLN